MDATELSPEAKASLQMSVRVIVRARFNARPDIIDPVIDVLGVRAVGIEAITADEASERYNVPRPTMFRAIAEARATVASVLAAEHEYTEPCAEEPKPE